MTVIVIYAISRDNRLPASDRITMKYAPSDGISPEACGTLPGEVGIIINVSKFTGLLGITFRAVESSYSHILNEGILLPVGVGAGKFTSIVTTSFAFREPRG